MEIGGDGEVICSDYIYSYQRVCDLSLYKLTSRAGSGAKQEHSLHPGS